MKKLTLIGITLFLFLAACESDKSRINKSEEIVNTFVSNLSTENNDVLNKLYQGFSKIKSYEKIKEFKVVNSSIDADKTVTIIGKSPSVNDNILFTLKKINGTYLIVNSKGLSSYAHSYLCQYCKKIGCLGDDAYDIDISQKCEQKRDEYKLLVVEIKENIEHNFALSNNLLRLQDGGFGDLYLHGDLTMKNQSRFSVPGNCYMLYYHFYNSSGDRVFTKEEMINFEPILYGQSITKSIMQQHANGFKKIVAQLKITSTDFIERIIAENITGNNCIADNNLL